MHHLTSEAIAGKRRGKKRGSVMTEVPDEIAGIAVLTVTVGLGLI